MHSALRAMSIGAMSIAAVALTGCEREVNVADDGVLGSSSRPVTVGSPSATPEMPGLPIGTAGSAAPMPGSMPAVDAIAGAGGGADVDASAPAAAAGATVMNAIDQALDAQGSQVADIQILALFLNAIELPAVGSAGVSLAQYINGKEAAILFVDWNGAAAWWQLQAPAYYIYTAASAERHIGLLYKMASYGIHAGDGAMDISGTPSTYKEYLAANEQGFAWVDYPAHALGGPPAAGAESALGEIVFKRWDGTRSSLTDALRYRARLDLSQTHVAFVEYADTHQGTLGQIVVQPIAGGPALVAAPSEHHQDRPAIDGDWVVWEEYLSSTDSVIRARNLTTGELRDLSSATGFRTNPDIRGTRVIWEDQQSGDGDIYFADLASGVTDSVAISGTGHSAATRLTADGLVWIETALGQMALLRARWAP